MSLTPVKFYRTVRSITQGMRVTNRPVSTSIKPSDGDYRTTGAGRSQLILDIEELKHDRLKNKRNVTCRVRVKRLPEGRVTCRDIKMHEESRRVLHKGIAMVAGARGQEGEGGGAGLGSALVK
ncbi:hypothetical protein EVAR_100524_1 [Eumeta japonica]|uniref:Uncharacterized protein n=1 Tax=Eumeta variegata TaxID=151549 RepID=A0A4C2A8R7_EUMVA|nr:hypothetical protein EVAR_100524_1 [Eumeta japonica]